MKKILTAALFLAATVSAQAVTPLWMRDVQISPDGGTIAFCYMGDIYTVPATGGTARQLTTQSSYEQNPIWSPDGSTIAFASDRFGGFDIFTMPSAGGQATRITFNSTSEIPQAFTPDGSSILFSANIQDPAQSAMFPRASLGELYSVPAKGGKTTQVLGTPALSISYSPDGDYFLYQDNKGMESTWRKHHISSVTRDIWKYEPATGRHTNLTERPGEDLNPVIDPATGTVYILSEPVQGDGYPTEKGWQTSINVYSFNIDNPRQLKQVSDFKTHPVRFLSIGGGTLCYTWDGEIYTQKPGAGARKVSIGLTRDDENLPEILTKSSGAQHAAVSPDGKEIAFTLRGEVFVTSVEYKTTKAITHTPQAESRVTFSHDNRSIVYDSDRDGKSQLYMASIARKEDPNFANATTISEEPVFQDLNVERSHPQFSPDGKKLAFIEDRTKLMVADMASKAVTQVTDGSQWYDLGDAFNYAWSPDSRFLTIEYVPNHHDPYYNIGVVSVEGGEITDLTGSGYMNGGPQFVLDGNAVMFSSDRYGMRSHASWGSQDDVFLCFMNQDAYDRFRLSKEDYELLKEQEKAGKTDDKADTDKKDKKKSKKDDKSDEEKKDDVKQVIFEPEGIEDRIVRITPNSSSLGSATLSADGETMYYTASFEGGFDLWKMDLRKKETKLISKSAGSGRFAHSGDGKTIFLLGSSLKKLDGDSFKPVDFSAELKIDHAAEREYMFDYVQREEKNRFYDAGMHGVDWDAYCSAYRRFLPHISNNYDFSEMLSELLGELNVSHTGSGYGPGGKTEPTAQLGLLYDWSYEGQGLKVSEIITGGPFDRASLKLQAGDIITHINGKEITDESDPSLLLMNCTGKKTLVSVKGKDDMVVLPISASVQNDLLYERWVKRNAEKVKELSGGRLGYVHIKGMNDASYRTIYEDIMGKYYECEGIVIDQRFNGGGRLHEDIEILFGGHQYLTQMVRGREACDMPSRRWIRPSIMLQCECDYSNAHGTPWVYRQTGLGSLVGTPVPGTMTSVNWVDLIDDSMYFGIPIIGYLQENGRYLENTQLEPDVLIYNTPEKIVTGEDDQLKGAVEELLRQIDAK